MEDFARDELARLVAEYGPGLAEEPRRVRALLRDCCGEYKAEIAALSAAGEEGAGTALLHASAGVADATAERLAQALVEDRALNEEAARWAVAAWAAALGVGLTSFSVGATPDTSPPPADRIETPATQPAAPPPPPPERTAPRPDPPGEATIEASGPGRAPPGPGPPGRGQPPEPDPPGKKRHNVRTAIIGTVVVVGGLGVASAFLGDQGTGPSNTTRILPTTTVVPPTTTTFAQSTTTTVFGQSFTVVGDSRTLTVTVPAGWEGVADDFTPSGVSVSMGYAPFDLFDFGVADDRVGATFQMFSSTEQDDVSVLDILDSLPSASGCDPKVSQGIFEDGDFRYAYANATCPSGGYTEIVVLYEPQSPFYVLVYEGRAIDDVDGGRLNAAFRTIETS